jgi:hypothetical protein
MRLKLMHIREGKGEIEGQRIFKMLKMSTLKVNYPTP